MIAVLFHKRWQRIEFVRSVRLPKKVGEGNIDVIITIYRQRAL